MPNVRTLPLVLLSLALPLSGQNSMRKARRPPSDTAARAGSAVPWRADLDAALAEAKQKQLPVFWYVPTLSGSPMDRKPELDRYLMAGPFSWPSTVELLAQHFVPVKQVPRGTVAGKYRLKPLQFVEPGWLVLDGDGNELGRLDQISSFHPHWFEAPLRRLCHQPDPGFVHAPALREAWTAYRQGERDAARAACEKVLAARPADAVAAEARFLVGACLLRSNRHAEGLQAFEALATALPEQPLAWKAAMEAEGHGPFVRGFEDFLPLPRLAVEQAPTDGSRAPNGCYDEPQLWQRSVAYLLAMEEGDGSIRDSIYDFGGADGVPNVHAAVTALAGCALLEADRRAAGGLDLGRDGRARIAAVLGRIRHAIADPATINTDDRDELLWAYAYRARFLARCGELQPELRAELQPLLQAQVEALQALQKPSGAWFHEYDNPFVIATTLQSLAQAKAQGAKVDDQVVDKGVLALLRCRAKNGAYSYGFPGQGEAQSSLEFGAGRMPHAELALLRSGKGSAEEVKKALVVAFRWHGLLAAVRKYDNHADRHGYGGFFFWYDMLARTEAIMAVPADGDRGLWQAQQRKLVLDLPEFDGCFVDSHELGKAYGTAMGLLCLAALDPR